MDSRSRRLASRTPILDASANLVKAVRVHSRHRAPTLAALHYLCETLGVPKVPMRILNIVSGLAVLFATLAFGHMLHHFSTHASPDDFHNPIFLADIVLRGILSCLFLLGGCLTLPRFPPLHP